MNRYLLSCLLLLVLSACASHSPRCGNRLTPINPQPIRWDLSSGVRAAAHPVKAARS